jgi:hypothetical protein
LSNQQATTDSNGIATTSGGTSNGTVGTYRGKGNGARGQSGRRPLPDKYERPTRCRS